MTPKWLFLIFVMEGLFTALIVYAIKKTSSKILFYQEIIDRIELELPDLLRNYRQLLIDFNQKITRRNIENPMTIQELGFFTERYIY